MNTNCLIIGICGISGAGKTRITNLLAERLNSTTIHWDDYDSLPDYEEPADYIAWFQGDRDYAAWKSPQLVKTLHSLKHGKSIDHPNGQKKLFPSSIIIFDAPLGYEHRATGQFIDFLIFLDVPPDILLIRRLQRDHLNGTAADIQKINKELDEYLNFTRPLYLDTEHEKNNADLVVDGTLSEQGIIECILRAIDSIRKGKRS